MKTILHILIIALIGTTAFAQDAGANENTQYVQVDHSHPDAGVLDGTDFFESELLCILKRDQAVTMLDSTDGEYVMIRFVCNGKTMEGWVKKRILGAKPVENHPRVTESGSVENPSIGAPGTVTPGLPDMDPGLEAISTGQTTGHIANILVKNNTTELLQVQPQVFYITSLITNQGHLAYIHPGISIPPNGVITIPVEGFCVDVTKPAVPEGNSLTPIKEWIPVDHPNWLGNPIPGIGEPVEGRPFTVIPTTPLKPFTPEDIPGSTSDPGFIPSPTTPVSPVIIIWPGTDIPIGGTFTKPNEIVPELVEALDRIARGFDTEREKNPDMTPFSPDPEKEREAVIQQTFWIYTAKLFGKKYEKKDFEGRVYDQFHTTTGTPVSALPKEQKDEIDSGITKFWITFQAVGGAAKIFATEIPEGTSTMPAEPERLVDPEEPPTLIKDEKKEKQCECGNIPFELYIWNTEPDPPDGWRGVQAGLYKSPVNIASVDINSGAGLPDHEIKAGKKGLKKGSAQIIELRNIDILCPCIEITDALKEAITALAKLEKNNRSIVNMRGQALGEY
jgi:hypothetical protein